MGKLSGKAMESMTIGQYVLCRNFEVRLAPPELANGTVIATARYRRPIGDRYKIGDHVEVEPVVGLGQRDLQAIANGPIMEPIKLYLPAGKITEAEYQERLDLEFSRAGIDRSEGC